MNSVSRGTIKLASADPKDAPLIDPKYLSNPFDLVNLREALREGMNLLKTSTMKDHFVRPLFAPKSDSDKDIDVSLKLISSTKCSSAVLDLTLIACPGLHPRECGWTMAPILQREDG